MKKTLSVVLALVMLLTMVSVPVFAADATTAKLTVVSASAHYNSFTADLAVDGDDTTYYSTSGYIANAGPASKPYNLIFDIGEVKTLTELDVYWSGNGWGNMPAETYKIHVSKDNVTYTELFSYDGLVSSSPTYDGKITYSGDASSGNYKARVVESNLFVRDVRYIKVEIIGWKYRASLAEIKASVLPADAPAPVDYTVNYVDEQGNPLCESQTVKGHYIGDEINEIAPSIDGYIADVPSKNVTLAEGTNEITFTYSKLSTSLGGQIRLPSNSYTAGLRFGVSFNKAAFGYDALGKNYSFAEVADKGIEVGIYLLPVDLLSGHSTLADYIMSGGTKAFKIPAKKVYSETDKTVTFTAVLTEIPEKDYNREVVAVAYICVNGGYTFCDEMRRSYAGVAQNVATSYENGKTTLTATQKTLLEQILGRTLSVK